MDVEMSVAQAAKELSITRQRVVQLVNNGQLQARKVGSIWVVDGASVEQRKAEKPHAGRRSAQAKRVPHKRKYTLMNADYEVLSFEYDEANNLFSASREIIDASRAPVGVVSPRGTHATAQALFNWWRHRAIPIEREGIDARLIELGLDSPEQIPFASLGLSLSDLYWIRPDDARELTWAQLNLFDNTFASSKAGWMGRIGEADSPDNTSEGAFPKKWVCRKSARVLLKGGDSQTPVNERAATLLHKRVLRPDAYVSYELETLDGATVSACHNFLNGREEFIPAWYLRPEGKKADGRRALAAYIEKCEELGALDAEHAVSQMIVCDYVLANTDRHWRNFGIVRNVDTLDCRPAPIFDSGSSLWYNVATELLERVEYAYASRPFNSNPVRQLLMTPTIDWLDVAVLDGYADEIEALFASHPLIAPRAQAIAHGVRKNIESVKMRLL